MVDKIIQGKTRTRRQFCSFYTESDPILTYMIKNLDIRDGDIILEPCAGDGDFIEKIIASTGNSYKIDALDFNPVAVEKLRQRFHTGFVSVRHADTLLDPTLDLFANCNGYYTKIIGNPPYGAWQDYDKRNLLKKIYGGYVRETYSLFIKRCIDLLKKDGILVFIVPDTFLALHLHKETREKILKDTIIKEILLIPSSFFPKVNFGYSNLCIITLQKNGIIKDNKIKIISVLDDISNLYEIAKRNLSVASSFEEIDQKEVIKSLDMAFLIGGDQKIRNFVNEPDVRLGDIADCVTGFYSGDNKKFLAVTDCDIKNAKHYTIIDKSLIEDKYLQQPKIIEGLNDEKKYIPILKGGNGCFTKETEWYILWDSKTVVFYRSDQKARFQNSQFYFKEGIGVPMVRGNHLHAFLLEKRLFDQSIVGIFPKDNKYFNYILAFLNSEVCSKMMKAINHTANNSANYLKKLPLIISDNIITEIDDIMNYYFITRDKNSTLERINTFFNGLYKV